MLRISHAKALLPKTCPVITASDFGATIEALRWRKIVCAILDKCRPFQLHIVMQQASAVQAEGEGGLSKENPS